LTNNERSYYDVSMNDEPNLMDLMARFNNPEAARKYLEAQRWPDGPVCPHCGLVDEACELKPKAGAKTHARKGVYKCRGCEKQFTVTLGTIYEASHIPLHKWVIAFHLLCSSKKGMSSHQLHRMLGITYKSAWFMTHRIRHAMTQPPMGEKLSGTVEVDETYVGGKTFGLGRGNMGDNKIPVVALVQRQGEVRSFPVERVTLENIAPLIKAHVKQNAHVNTDEAAIYRNMKPWFPKHRTVNHKAKEYVRYEVNRTVHTVEGYFSLVKRGVYGVYHHWSKQHIHRYLAEFDFRYNQRGVTDGARTVAALGMVEGKRLTYRPLTGGE
jgi:transposase-like protein